jgi:hypothetical protein
MSFVTFDGASWLTTPTYPEIQIAGDIDMRATVRVPAYAGAWRTFISTSGRRTGSHFRQANGSAVLEAIHADGGWREGEGNVDLPSDVWVKARVTIAPGDAFRFSIDGADAGSAPINGNPAVPETTVPVCIGAYIGGSTSEDQFMVGDIMAVTVRDGIDGPVAFVFNASDPNIPDLTPDGTTWTDQNGHVWTVHGDGITVTRSTPTRKTIRKRDDTSVYLGNPTMRTIRQ